jgi:uncharacterized protein YciI
MDRVVSHACLVPTMSGMYAVLLAFSDDTARLALRPGHRERLAELAADGKLLAAGPWADDSGALLVFLADTREELDQILAADPYYSSAGVTIVWAQEWSLVTRHHSIDGL